MSLNRDKSVPLISQSDLQVSLLVIKMTVLLGSVMGVITNIINIRVFVKRGVTSESTTVSLFALAVADFFGCLLLIPSSLCFYFENYWDLNHFLIQNCVVFTSITTDYPHFIFYSITCWVTVYMSVERAMCVLMPLKVKAIIRPKITITAMVFIFVFFFIFHIPYAAHSRIIWITNMTMNRTRAQNYETALGSIFLQIIVIANSTILTILAMIIAFIATFVMLRRLKSASRWRNSNSTPKEPSSASKNQTTSQTAMDTEPNGVQEQSRYSSKEIEMVRTVTTVTTIYLVCLACSQILGMTIYAIPGMSLSGMNRNLFILVNNLKYLFDVTNSSVNMFFYVKMSSKYRVVFYEIFTCCVPNGD